MHLVARHEYFEFESVNISVEMTTTGFILNGLGQKMAFFYSKIIYVHEFGFTGSLMINVVCDVPHSILASIVNIIVYEVCLV